MDFCAKLINWKLEKIMDYNQLYLIIIESKNERIKIIIDYYGL